jgi:nucleotide-binding universal stress UspA family protein
MRRVLVPLDGSAMAASILPDARRLAREDGELILVQDVTGTLYDHLGYGDYSVEAEEAATTYLEAEAGLIRSDGVRVKVQTLGLIDRAMAIGEAARLYNADFIACATHGRSVLGRLVRGSVVWNMLALSTVPVLLRHPGGERTPASGAERRILVPLDGSELAEKALPFVRQLALEWNATLYLIRVVPEIPVQMSPFGPNTVDSGVIKADLNEADEYLRGVAAGLPGTVHTGATSGGLVEVLIDAVRAYQITDIIMASHGRTGLSRVVLGSVTDALVQRLDLPILVVPSLVSVAATAPEAEKTAQREPALALTR